MTVGGSDEECDGPSREKRIRYGPIRNESPPSSCTWEIRFPSTYVPFRLLSERKYWSPTRKMRAWTLLTEGSGSKRSASLLLPIRISFRPIRISTGIPFEIETERIAGVSAGIIANPPNFSIPSAKGMPEAYPIFPEEASLSDLRRGHIPVFPNIREACRILWREVILSVREVHMAWENNDSLFRRIVESSPEAIVCSDRDGIIRIWNGGAEAIFGYGAREAVGESLDIIVPQRIRDRHWA